MFFKTYQKLLGASCLALCLVGCRNGESPVEMRVNSNGEFSISSKVDSVTIQGVKLNRGNCVVSFSQIYARAISIQDFKDEASTYEYIKDKKNLSEMQNKISQLEQKGVMMEPQTLKFGESLKGISQGCNIIEAEIQTDKGSWTFNFDK
ncbi:hypothetical protein HPHPP8B_1625 [Helicobacter pylori Hp P-8b]|uniref:hypothetical protein n=1 Tax=Helicobacter pylori TaxID=210 RepID=UPI00026AEE30|nr:hypothetical protein [Helicobacter pylori]EJC01149.1 hypothetical protein HPHPP8_1635 [Helicobacter pylori Hp P-8]EJC26056.1 hypothetical protein HPHPP8B_1625 [Helicobacter pylori Hp P-8b]